MRLLIQMIIALCLVSCVRVTPAPVVRPPVPQVPQVKSPTQIVDEAPKPDPAKAAEQVIKKAPKINPGKILNSLEKLPALPLPGNLLK